MEEMDAYLLVFAETGPHVVQAGPQFNIKQHVVLNSYFPASVSRVLWDHRCVSPCSASEFLILMNLNAFEF